LAAKNKVGEILAKFKNEGDYIVKDNEYKEAIRYIMRASKILVIKTEANVKRGENFDMKEFEKSSTALGSLNQAVAILLDYKD